MLIEPHISLVFNGECDAAFALYQQCLGGTVTFRLTWGESPMADQAPSEWRDKILHATLTVGGTALSGGDVLPGQYERPQGFQLQLNLDDAGSGRADLHAARGRRTGDRSPAADVLGAAVRRRRGPLRHPVGNQLRRTEGLSMRSHDEHTHEHDRVRSRPLPTSSRDAPSRDHDCREDPASRLRGRSSGAHTSAC